MKKFVVPLFVIFSSAAVTKLKFCNSLFIFAVLLSVLAGCGGAGKASAPSYSAESSAGSGLGYDSGFTQYEGLAVQDEGAPAMKAAAQGQEPQAPDAGENIPVPEQTRKLIKKAEIHIDADSALLDSEGMFSASNETIDSLLKKYNAYAEKTRIYSGSAYYQIRVPEASYEAMLSGLGVLGRLRSRTESAEDVTLKYYDLAGRLATKKTLLLTFQSYLVKAKNIEEIMQVETRIAELQNEIDWLGTQLTQLSSLIDFATIELYLSTSQAHGGYTLGDRIGDLFGDYGDFASGGLVVILGIIIFGVPIIVLCLFALWLFFGKVGILKKAFRFVLGGREQNTEKSGGEKT